MAKARMSSYPGEITPNEAAMTEPEDADTAYANAPFIPGAETFPPRWKADAESFRTSLGPRARLKLPYGRGARQKFDLFLPEEPPLGLMMFVHGGFWRAFGREDWSHFAAGGVDRGWAVAVPSYTLAPQARIRDITAEMVQALAAGAEAVPGVDIALTGHSAGGHQCARLVCEGVLDGALAARVVRAVPISPLSDLRPLMATRMNEDFRLDMAEAEAESPSLYLPRKGTGVHVWVGAAERPAFIDQARWLSAAWNCPLTIDPGRHHFDVIDGLCDGESPLMRTICPEG